LFIEKKYPADVRNAFSEAPSQRSLDVASFIQFGDAYVANFDAIWEYAGQRELRRRKFDDYI
jgi:hypothetical protein